MKVKSPQIFISHSHEDLSIVEKFEKNLAIFGIKVFVAHKDITPSANWSKEILRAIKKCEVFLPMLSDNFRNSKTRWPDHETGMARVLKKFIYPISLDGVDPYGSIADIQAKKVSKLDENIDSIVLELCSTLIDKKILHRTVVIKAFSKCKNFHEGEVISKLLDSIEKKGLLKNIDISNIVKAAIDNDQILNLKNKTASAEFVLRLKEKYGNKINEELLNEFNKRIKSLTWKV